MRSVLSAATDEFVAHIVDLDIEAAEVTIAAKDMKRC